MLLQGSIAFVKTWQKASVLLRGHSAFIHYNTAAAVRKTMVKLLSRRASLTIKYSELVLLRLFLNIYPIFKRNNVI